LCPKMTFEGHNNAVHRIGPFRIGKVIKGD
jgi:hypothetical protein